MKNTNRRQRQLHPYMPVAIRNLLELCGYNARAKRMGFDSTDYLGSIRLGPHDARDPWAWVVYRNSTGRKIGQIGSRCTLEQWQSFITRMGEADGWKT